MTWKNKSAERIYHEKPEQAKEKKKEYYRTHKEEAKVYAREYYRKNRDKLLERYKGYNKEYFNNAKLAVLRNYSHSETPFCEYCKTENIDILTIYHEGQKSVGNNTYIRIVKSNFPEGYKVLCMNCMVLYKKHS